MRRNGRGSGCGRFRCPTTTAPAWTHRSPTSRTSAAAGGGGALTAGLFLRDFVGDGIPWAHLDIAGPAWLDEPYDESPKGGTGFGVRTLIALLEGWSQETTT